MNIQIITGNKGGVGKSFISIMLADYLIRNNKKFLVGDTETATGQATTWNVLRRHVDESLIRQWTLNNIAGFEALVNEIAIHAEEDITVIVDTGASMMNSLTENLNFLSEIQFDLKVNVGIVFVAGPLPDSVIAARTFLRAQKEIKNPVRTSFLLTSPTEKVEAGYKISEDVNIQKAISELNYRTIFLGPIRQEYFDDTMKNFKIPSYVLKDIETGYAYRKNLDLWLKTKFDNICKEILEN